MVRAAYSAYICGRIDEHTCVVILCECASAEDVVSVRDFHDITET